MATAFVHQTVVYIGSVDRPAGESVTRVVRETLADLRKKQARPASAVAFAKPDYAGEEEVASIYAVCTRDEADRLEDVVANVW
jgi:hypothetical protein